MSTTIATVAGTTGSGLGTERHIIYAVNSARWWAFAFTSTNVISTWYSSDGSSWTAGATHTLGANHNSEGRSLAVAYKNISGVDVVHIGYIGGTLTAATPWLVRATISSTTITFHTSDTQLNGGNTTNITSPTFSGGSMELDSNSRAYFANGLCFNTTGFQQDIDNARSTADPGGAEQATAVTWTMQDIDSSPANECKSNYLCDTGSGNMGLLADNGSGTSNNTAVLWFTWNGTTWSSSSSATGTVTAFDKDDWGAVLRTTSDVHLVYRSGSSSWVHRRWNGTSWGAGQSIPTQASKAGGGVALASDGTSVWLFAIDSDSANTVRYIKWDGSAWGSWAALESSTQTRTFLGCTKDVQSSAIIAYWSESTSFVAAKLDLSGGPPPDAVVSYGYSSN